MKKHYSRQKSILALIFILCLSLFASPNNTYAANPNIKIETPNNTFKVGDQFSVSYKLDTADFTVMSLDLSFTYDKTKLDFLDADITQAGSQLNTQNSDLTTITKKLADEQIGELKIAGTRIGGLLGEIELFEASFIVLETGPVVLTLDNNTSKLLDSEGLIDYDVMDKMLTLEGQSPPENPNSNMGNTSIVINHSQILEAPANQPLIIDAVISPITKIKEARIYYKNTIETSPARVKMMPIDGENFRGVIPQEKVIIGEMTYFFGIIDSDDEPYRYPEADNQFFTTNVVIDSGPPVLSNPPVNTNQNPEINSYPNTKNSNQNFTYSKTTATGPEEIYLLIITVILFICYIFYSESRKPNKNMVRYYD